jgi:hypothetical protein
MLKINKEKYFQIGMAGFLLFIAFFPYPKILGLWETQITFHAFAPESAWLNNIIHPRANIAGYEYAPLHLVRSISSILGLSFFTVRLLPIIYGLLALLFFYRILKNWCSEFTSLLVTGLLATNPLFIVFQHQLIIVIAELLCILGCFYFFLEAQIKLKSAIYFGFMCAITATLYHTGRYFLIALVGLWIVKNVQIKDIKNSIIRFFPAFKRFSLGFVFTLFILNPANILRFFSYKFLIPEEGGAAANEFAMGFGDLIANLNVNVPITLHSFLGSNSFYGKFSSDVVFGVPYQLINWPLLILLIVGLATIIFDRQKLELIALLCFLFLCVPAISQTWPHIWTSLSPYRQFYALIPIFLVIAFAINWLVDRLQNDIWISILYFLVVGMVGFQTYSYINETYRFNKLVQKTKCQFDKENKYVCSLTDQRYLTGKKIERAQFEHHGHYYSPFMNGYHFLENYALPYKAYVNKIVEKMEMRPFGEEPIVIYAPANHFQQEQGHSSEYNYHQQILALYLEESGIDVNYFVPYPGSKQTSAWGTFFNFLMTRFAVVQPTTGRRLSRFLKYPLTYKAGEYGKGRLFWGNVKRKLRGRIPINYRNYFDQFFIFFQLSTDSEDYHFVKRKTSFGDTHIYLVTTEFEKTALTIDKADYITIVN